MHVPSSSAFSPLPELIAEFGIPDPFEILDLLQNELEQVDTTTATWNGLADDLDNLAADLEQQSGSVFWTGAAANGFRSNATDVAASFRGAAGNLRNCSQQQKGLQISTLDVIQWVLTALALLVALIATAFAIAMAASVWTFGSSLLVWLSYATGLSLGTIAAITGCIATLLGFAAGVVGAVKGEIDQANTDVPCTTP
jgi:hypothetical protein